MADKTKPRAPVVKALFAVSGNRCAFNDPGRAIYCEQELTNPSWRSVRARICHIAGERPKAARYDPSMTDEERRDFSNLILLCPNCHNRIDELEPAQYDVASLQAMKERAERRYQQREPFADDATLQRLVKMALGVYDRLSQLEPPEDFTGYIPFAQSDDGHDRDLTRIVATATAMIRSGKTEEAVTKWVSGQPDLEAIYVYGAVAAAYREAEYQQWKEETGGSSRYEV